MTSLTSRMPSFQIVVAMVAAMNFRVGHGPRSASSDDTGESHQAESAERLRLSTLRRVIAGLVDAVARAARSVSWRSSSLDAAPCR